MELVSTLVYCPRSYECIYKEAGQANIRLQVLSIKLVHQDMLLLEAVTRAHLHRGMRLCLSFLSVPLASPSVRRSAEGIYCTFSLHTVIRILSQHRLPSSAAPSSNATLPHPAQRMLSLLQDIELQELVRNSEEQHLTEIKLQAEEQTRIINAQRRLVTQRRADLLPRIKEELPFVLIALLESGALKDLVHLQLLIVWEFLKLPLVPLTPSAIRKQYGDWMKRTELHVLSLSDDFLDTVMDVSLPDKSVLPNQKLRAFSINTFRLASGSKTFFVTKMRGKIQPLVGEFRRKGNTIVEAKALPTQGFVSDWFLYFAGVMMPRASPGTIQNFYTALVAGTAYVLAQEALQ